MFSLLHNTSSCFQRPDILWDQRGRRTLIAIAVFLLRKTEAGLIKKRHLILSSFWAKDTQKDMFMLEGQEDTRALQQTYVLNN